MPEDNDTQDQDAPDPATGVAALTAKYGDVQRAAERLFDTNARLLKKVERLEKRPELPEGGRILTKEESASFTAFEALKVKPDQIEALTKERDDLKDSLVKRDRETARDAAARTIGIEGKDLSPFAGSDALAYEVREEEVEANGKKEKKPVAYVKDGEGKEHKLADYGKATWGRGFEALVSTPTQQSTGTPYPLMTGDGRPATGKDPVEARISRMKEQAAARTNPLLPTAKTS